ncbi:hypothetical protein D3C71_1960450 [compost metagenome]
MGNPYIGTVPRSDCCYQLGVILSPYKLCVLDLNVWMFFVEFVHQRLHIITVAAVK